MSGAAAGPGLVRLLEGLGAAPWPAEMQETVRGWMLGFTRGVTRRANSVIPLSWTGGELEAAIAEVEARYHGRGLPPCFKMTEAAQPSGLDAALEARGYRVEGRSWVMTADAAVTAARCPAVAETAIAPDPDPLWCSLAWPADRPAGFEADIRAGIAGRIGGPRAFATVICEGRPAGVALGAVVGERCCITAVSTLPAFRRRGVARTALGALAEWATANGARRLFLQVEENNPAAIALYRTTGFGRAYDYWYRVR